MEGFKTNLHNFAPRLTLISLFLLGSVNAQNGQINTPCTTSMISTFTPCMNYITGSTSNGSSPTSNCCNALRSLMGTSMDCACLLMTASVPVPLNFINRTLALSLPRICNSGGVPVQCQAAGAPLPAPGPVQFVAPPPPAGFSPQAATPQFGTPRPASALSPQASKATTFAPAAGPAATELPPPVSAPVEGESPAISPRIRPVPTPSASSPSMISLPRSVCLILMGFMMFNL